MKPRAPLGPLAVAATLALSLAACGGGTTTSATSTTLAGTSTTTQGVTPTSDPSSPTSSAATSSASAATSTPTAPTSAGSSTATSTRATTSGGGIAPAPTATVGTTEFCSTLRSADYRPTDLTTLPTGSVQDTVGEVVERQERLASVLTPAELTADWQTTTGAFDAIAQRVSDSGKDAAVAGIVKTELARVAPARERVLEAAAACR